MPGQPQIGEVITARYRGVCTRTGEPYQPGARIARDAFGYYLDGAPDAGGELHLGGGEGYGYRPYDIGEVLWHEAWNAQEQRSEPGVAVVITRAKATYYREDGLSFGVGDDRGHVYSALARPATPEEAAPLLERRAARQAAEDAAQRRAAGLRTLFDWRAPDADTPPGRSLAVQGRTLKIDGGFTAYGTGKELVVDVDGEHVWMLHNNGMDGDDWSRNNVSTGGAGAVGTRFPLTPERRAFLAEHWPEPRDQPAETGEDDGTL